MSLTGTFDTRFSPPGAAVVQDFADQVYTGRLKSNDLHPGLWREYFDRFRARAEAGFGKTFDRPDDLDEWGRFQGVQRNLMEFSALKQQALVQELQSHLYDANGNKRQRKDWDAKIKNTLERHHKYWLRTELDATQKTANAAAFWQRIQQSKSLYPNLRYETVGDDRVRDEHAALDGAVYPVDDPFWDEWFPPAGWGCRCIVVQTDEPIREKVPDKKVAKGFRHNPGKSGTLFDESHPYFSVDNDLKRELLGQAERQWTRLTRIEVKKYAKDNIFGKSFNIPGFQLPISVSMGNVTNVISHFHRFEPERNNLLMVLEMALKSSIFHDDAPNNDPKKPHIVQFFYYRLLLDKLNFFFEIGQVIDGKGFSGALYNINDINKTI